MLFYGFCHCTLERLHITFMLLYKFLILWCFDLFWLFFLETAISEEDPWSLFTCPAQPLLTFSVLSPGSPVPPVQVCFTIAL